MTLVQQAPPARDAVPAGPGTGWRLTPRTIPVALLLAAVAVIPMLLNGFLNLDVRGHILIGSLSVVFGSLASLRMVTAARHNQRGIAAWRAGPWFLLWTALAFGVASLTWLDPQTVRFARLALPSVVTALTLVQAALIAWTAGYLIGPPRGLRTGVGWALGKLYRGTNAEVTANPRLPWLLFGLGAAAQIATGVFAGRFGYLGDAGAQVAGAPPYLQLLTILSTAMLFAVAVAAYQAFTVSGVGPKTTLWTLVAIQIAVATVSGNKEPIILCVLAVLIPYGAIRGRVSKPILIIGTLLFLLVVIPFTAAYRQTVRTTQTNLSTSDAIASVPGILDDVLNAKSPGEALVSGGDTLLRRVRLVDNVAIIMQLTPEFIPYRSPMEFAVAPVIGLIPRAVWPDKPVIVTGYQFSQEYLGLPSTLYTSSAITPLGDLFRHGGWLVAMAGMFILGTLYRLFDMFIQPERDARGIFFLLVFLPMMVKSEIDVYSWIITAPAAVVTAIIGARLACRKPRQPVRDPAVQASRLSPRRS